METPITQHIVTVDKDKRNTALKELACLHVGCGDKKLPGATGIDILKLPSVDIVHNLDTTPWPVEKASYDVVYAHSVLEHVGDIVAFMDECWDALKSGGRLVIVAPYFRSIDAFTDPTHKIFLTSRSLDYFIDMEGTLSDYRYSDKRYKKIGFWYGWPEESKNPLKRGVKNFIQQHSKFYDQYLSLLFPMKIVVWELEAIK